jgi:hypothetical protein
MGGAALGWLTETMTEAEMALLRILLALGFLCGTAVPALAASPAVGSSADRDQGSGDRPEHPMAGGRGDQVPVGAYGRQVAPGFVETSYRDVGVTAILVPPAAADS